MSQPWWKKILEFLGRPQLPISDRTQIDLATGVPDADDASGSMDWFEFSSSEKLFHAWSPVTGSIWEPFHCAPLFAALDRIPISKRGPTDPALALEIEAPLSPLRDWLSKNTSCFSANTWVIVDLPGVLSPALAIELLRNECQTICTFDHWPHTAGLLKPEQILGQLLRHASLAATLRDKLSKNAPPAWICDRQRLGGARGRPRQFDNRYFLDDSILPGSGILRSAQIHRVVYISEEHGQTPVADIGSYLAFLQKESSIEVVGLGMNHPEAGFYPLPPCRPWTHHAAFQRAAAGGFGTLIPTESTSSG